MNASPGGLPRWIELAAAVMVLVIAAPVLALVAVAVSLTSEGPILYRHRRVGRGGAPFWLLKFRTMHVGRTGPEVTSGNDARITRVGRVLRRSKLDELPGLWNIVRGDMGLVGPRPESVAYVELTDRRWQEVLRVRPGVTDPTTLRLRNEEQLLASAGAEPETFYRRYLIPYKLRGYQEYLAARNWWSDIGVLARTVVAVIFPQIVPHPSLQDVVSGGEPRRASPNPQASPRPVSFADEVASEPGRAWLRRLLAKD